MEENIKLNEEQHEQVDGGTAEAGGGWRAVKCVVAKNYLALRTQPDFKRENEIAQIWPGTVFSAKSNKKSGIYVWASYGGKQGWVNGTSRCIKWL